MEGKASQGLQGNLKLKFVGKEYDIEPTVRNAFEFFYFTFLIFLSNLLFFKNYLLVALGLFVFRSM